MSTVKTIATYPQGGSGQSTLGTAGQVLKTNSGADGVEWGTVSGSPAGSVTAFAGSSAPTDWLLCDGSTVSQATYASLYAVIGHTYGSDPGGGNFILPDLRGNIPVGKDSGTFSTLGGSGGEETHTLSEAELASHTHSLPQYVAAYGSPSGTTYSSATNSSSEATSKDTGSAGSNTAHNNLQPYLVMNYIIKT